MSESTQLVRQWKTLQLLEASRAGCMVQEPIHETEVCDRTNCRDLKVLQNVFDIKEQTGQGGLKRWKMKPLADQLGFNHTELLAIHMRQQFLEPLAGTSFGEGNRSVLRKVKGSIDENAVRYVQESTWHHSQRIFALDHGTLIAEFQLPDTQEIKRWIMSSGPGPEVLGPQQLMDEIQGDLATMIVNHAQSERVE